MKIKNLKNQMGLTLVELILALSMFAIILLGSSRLESSAVKLTASSLEIASNQNDLSYAYRILEKDLLFSDLFKVTKMPDPTTAAPNLVHDYEWIIRPHGAPADGTQDIKYQLNLSYKFFRRTVGNTSEDLVPPGQLTLGPLKHPDAPNNRLAMWMTNALKLMTVNLSLATPHLSANSKFQPGYARSFLIRTGNVKDCRGIAGC